MVSPAPPDVNHGLVKERGKTILAPGLYLLPERHLLDNGSFSLVLVVWNG
jgi:hypothetical protein